MIRGGGRLLQQRQHVLRDGERPEEVGVERRPQRLHRQLRRPRRRGELGVDPGVVHQHVELPVLLVHPAGGGLGALRVGHVEDHGLGVQPFAPEPGGGFIGLLLVTGSEDHGEPVLAQLAADLETDALVRPRHQCHSLLTHWWSLLSLIEVVIRAQGRLKSDHDLTRCLVQVLREDRHTRESGKCGCLHGWAFRSLRGRTLNTLNICRP